MRVAYIGPGTGTSLHRARALQRIGHAVTIIDPWDWLGHSKWVAHWEYSTGAIGVSLLINRRIRAAVRHAKPHLIFVDQGEFLGPRLIRGLREFGAPVVNYCQDDPFPSSRARFRAYRKALPFYDLVAVVREPNQREAIESGASRVVRVWRCADEIAHRADSVREELRERFASGVAFVGTWMPERGPFLARLIARDVPLAIWGDRWHKAPEWPIIKPHWRGPGLFRDEEYASAVLSAKICLGLLSKGNRDFHTTRSMEIPALAGLLCAERTSEHVALYSDGEEAVFWRDPDECADLCKALLADEKRRQEIARRGHERALRNNHFNEPLMAFIVDAAMKAKLSAT